jgi:predicted DNA-binding transcriptional regulator AlpA
MNGDSSDRLKEIYKNQMTLMAHQQELLQLQQELFILMKSMDTRLALPDQLDRVLEEVSGRMSKEVLERLPGVVPVADQWLRANEVMSMLGISPRTLYTYTCREAFDTKKIGRTMFYSKESVMRLV